MYNTVQNVFQMIFNKFNDYFIIILFFLIFFPAYYDGHWDVRYIRQCALKGEVGPAEGRWCKERMGNFRVRVKVCHCDNKDGCNTASQLGANMSAVLLLMIGTSFIWTCFNRKS